MKPFRIQFLGIRTAPEAMGLWREMGLEKWAEDRVERQHHWGEETVHLRISHEVFSAPKYLNVRLDPSISEPRATHIGMRATPEEAEEWRTFFSARGIPIREEYRTVAHTNINRRFHDIYFATAAILGVDVEISVEIPNDAG
jgi:hypothetical protein